MDGGTLISSDRPVVLQEKEVHDVPMEAGFSVLTFIVEGAEGRGEEADAGEEGGAGLRPGNEI